MKIGLYNLRQAPRDWFDSMRNFPIDDKFQRKNDNTTLFQTEYIFLYMIFDDLVLLINPCSF